MHDNYLKRRNDDAAPNMGTLHYPEGGGLSMPQNLGGLSRRRSHLTDRLVRGWRVLLRPAEGRPGGPLHEISAGETLTPVGTVTRDGAPGEFHYQPMLYAHANLQEYRARRRKEEHISRFVLGALAVAVTVSVGIVLFVHPSAKKPTVAAQPKAAAVVAAPAQPAPPAFLTYEIKKGETLGGIAKRHHVKVKALMAANGLGEKSKLKIGQKVLVPHAPGARPVAGTASGAPAPLVALPAPAAVGADKPQTPGKTVLGGSFNRAGPVRSTTEAGVKLVGQNALVTGMVAQSLGRPPEALPAAARMAGINGTHPGTAPAKAAPPPAVRSSAPRVYTVRRGDFTELIAKRYGLKPDTILFANKLHARSILQPGQVIKVPPANGYYHTVRRGETLGKLLKRGGVDEAKFRRLNPEVGDNLRAKQVVFIPGTVPDIEPPRKAGGGVRGYRKRDERKRATRGFWGDIGRAVSDGFNWPISSRTISSGFGERGRHDWHPGLDIRAGTGTPIRAARDGVVLRSGWEGGYGRMVEIDHGGGVITRYAHASKLLVGAGERVKAGEVIGKVGSSGRSTGPHLHYEVRVNGRAVNPKSVH